MAIIQESIVFFGTGPVAAKSLKQIAELLTIELVITKPRPKHHHGSVPVIETAEALNIPIKTVSDRAELDTLIESTNIQSRLGLLIDFGIIVSQKVIDYFELGILNSHFSLLPELRGADPITFAILSGQDTTGVSLMRIVAAMDEGPLVAFKEVPILKTMTAPQLTDVLIQTSVELITQEVPNYISKQLVHPQSITGRAVSYSRKLTKDDAVLDWSKPAKILEREVRAFIEWPGSKTVVGGIEVTIMSAHVDETPSNESTGTVIAEKNYLAVKTSSGRLVIDTLKPAGKREMPCAAFLAGYGNLL